MDFKETMLNKRLWTACITPFDSSGTEVDYTSLEKLLRLQAKSELGVVLFGSTGEGLSLSDQEKRKILQFVIDLKLDLPIICGVSSHNLPQALEWIDFCNNFPIAGYLIPTPLYTKPGVIGQTLWFEKLLDKALHKVMLYNIPSRTGVKLYTETVKNLKDNDKVTAIKECSGTFETMMEYQIAAPEIKIFCGDDGLLPSMMLAGAFGLVSVASNVWPKETKSYFDACYGRQSLKTVDLAVWWQATKALFSATNPIPLKALMLDAGLIEHATVRLPLSVEDFKNLHELHELHKQIITL